MHGLPLTICRRRLGPGSKCQGHSMDLRAAHNGLIVPANDAPQLFRSLLVTLDRIIECQKRQAVARIQCCIESHFGASYEKGLVKDIGVCSLK